MTSCVQSLDCLIAVSCQFSTAFCKFAFSLASNGMKVKILCQASPTRAHAVPSPWGRSLGAAPSAAPSPARRRRLPAVGAIAAVAFPDIWERAAHLFEQYCQVRSHLIVLAIGLVRGWPPLEVTANAEL
jgi:hypothetical protein